MQLIQGGTLDTETAAILWLAVEHKASFIVAAQPRLAGKTTLLEALSHLFPSHFEVVHTRGQYEDFSFLHAADPFHTYIVVNEISDHLPRYLWGSGVREVFEALSQGFSMAATMHADTAEEVILTLTSAPLMVPFRLVARLHLIITLFMGYGPEGTRRRVQAVTMVLPAAEEARRPHLMSLVDYDPRTDSFLPTPNADVQEALAHRLGLRQDSLGEELHRRREFVEDLVRSGLTDPGEVRARILRFYSALSA